MLSGMQVGPLAKLASGSRTNQDITKAGAGLIRGPSYAKKLTAAPWSDTWPAPGATLDLDFANNRGFVRGLGQGGVMDGVTFTRASNGTFVGPDGLLKGWTRESPNLLTFPQDFDSAIWTNINDFYWKNYSNITANMGFAPDGTYTADSFFDTAGQTGNCQRSNGSDNGPTYSLANGLTVSCYVKNINHRYFMLIAAQDSAGAGITVDLETGSITGSSGLVAGTGFVISVGNGWYRVGFTMSTASAGASHIAGIKVGLRDNSNYTFTVGRYQVYQYAQQGTGVLVWGAQLELGSTATEYFPTNINVPRFDWAGTEVVAQRNLLRFTETFAWSGLAASITQGQLDPDGGTTAVLLSSTGTTSYFYQTASLVVGEKYTFYIYAKENQSSTVALTVFGMNHRATFNLSEGGSFTGYLGTSFSDAQIQPVGSGWFLCSAVLTASATAVNVGVGNYSASAVSALYLWHPQLEAGDTATPYQAVAQPTTNTPLRSTATCNGLLIEEARTNRLLWCRDATQTQWAKTDITAAKDQTGIDGVANAASSLTATDDGGTCIQTITLASGSRTGSVYLKRLVGSGTVQVSLDGSTWSTVDLSADEWRRIVLSGTVTNPVVGIKLAVSGDAVAMDFGQVEDGAFATTPILTTGASATRAVDAATMQGENFNGWITQGKGTMTCTFLDTLSTGSFWSITVGSVVNYLQLFKQSATSIRFNNGYSSNLSDVISTASVPVPGGFNTASVGWQNYNTSMSVSGQPAIREATTRSKLVFPSFTFMRIGSNTLGNATTTSCIKRLTYFPDRLKDDGLQQISGQAT